MHYPSPTHVLLLFVLSTGLLGCPGQATSGPEWQAIRDYRKADHSSKKDGKIIRPGDLGPPADSEPLPDGTFTAQISSIQKNFSGDLTAAYCSNAYPSGLPAGMNIMGQLLGQGAGVQEYLVVRWVGKATGTFTCGPTKAEIYGSFKLSATEQPFGWSTDGSCTITVTQLDAVGGRMKGTFSGTLTRINGTGPSTVEVKAGVFDVPRNPDNPSYCN
jgi:hypothetical protein